MGYDYNLQGWCRTKLPIDLEAFKAAHPGLLDFVRFHVTGQQRNLLLFAGDGKSVIHYFVGPAAKLVESFGGGHGIITVTGEISYDGKDHFLLLNDGVISSVPLRDVYEPNSPWHSLYQACHYMARSGFSPSSDLSVLDTYTSIRGWLRLHQRVETTAIQSLLAELETQHPALKNGVSFSESYHPVLLFGQDGLNAPAIIAAIAQLAAKFPEAYGLLYCSRRGGGEQIPVKIEAGMASILRAISIDPAAQPRTYPVPALIYAGLGSGAAWTDLKGPVDLPTLLATFNPLFDGRTLTVTPGNDATADPEAYTFQIADLVCEIRNSGSATPDATESEWPFRLYAYLDSGADPDVLADRMVKLAKQLAELGVEVKPHRVNLTFDSYVSIPSSHIIDNGRRPAPSQLSDLIKEIEDSTSVVTYSTCVMPNKPSTNDVRLE